MAELKRMVYKDRQEQNSVDFSNAAGIVGMAAFESKDRSIKWNVLVSDTEVTPAHFNAFDNGEVMPVCSLLLDQAVGKVYFIQAATNWEQVAVVS